MIRHPIPPPALDARVDREVPGWRTKAKTRTAGFKQKRKFEETSSIWSEVKPLYMTLQGENKCIYCERKFGSREASTVEHDLEHFRPKSHVDAWQLPASLAQLGIVIRKPRTGNSGYYLLPYNLLNYASSCKTCNTRYKLDRFPIGGGYKLKGTDPKSLLKSEKPWLIYPVGEWDVDPEDVIGFFGMLPQAKSTSRHFKRGLVTIAFFGLDDLDMRSDLFLERATAITALHPQLEVLGDPRKSAAAKANARKVVDFYTSSKAAHSSCSRSFQRLFAANPAKAQQVFDKALDFMLSKS